MNPAFVSAFRVLRIACLGAGLVAAMRGEDRAAEARRTLRDVLAREGGWIKVHAAEVLANHGEAARVREAFLEELKAHGSEPQYRIGIWRTLALASANETGRADWVGRIRAVFVDPASPDRLHAVETLGKLGGPHPAPVVAAAKAWLRAVPPEDAAFGLWVCWQAGEPDALRAIIGLLDSPQAAARSRAAYVLYRSGTTEPAALAALARAADAEPADSPGRTNIVGAACRLKAAPARLGHWRQILDRVVGEGAPGARYAALQALLPLYRPVDVPRLLPLLRHEHPDVRTGAAAAILAAGG